MSKTIKESNPFVFEENGKEQSGIVKLEMTPELISKSNARATELMRAVAEKPELHKLGNLALDRAETQDVVNLIEAVFNEEILKSDAEFLKDADEDQLSRLLESRRSDRSKAKSKGPRTDVNTCQTFISAMYAELLVRLVWNKPMQQATVDLDYDELKADQDALNRKIRSLQSKQSRLRKTAEFVESDATELKLTQDEIARLVSLRTTTGKVSAKTIIKNVDSETLRKALESVDMKSMTQDEQDKIAQMIEQLA